MKAATRTPSPGAQDRAGIAESTEPAARSLSTRDRLRPAAAAITALTAALLAAIILSILTGDSEVARVVTLPRALVILAHHTLHAPLPDIVPYPQLDAIVWEQRVPRALCGALVGILLAMAGVAFQSLLRNPLADPYMVGVSAGSALGSVLVSLALGSAVGAGLFPTLAPTIGAFAAGLLTMAIVYRLSQRSGRLSTHSFLLAGIIVGTILWAVLQLVLALVVRSRDPGRAGAILMQQLGSVQFVGWRDVGLLLPFGFAGVLVMMAAWRELNLMALGEESAAHLGVDTESLKRRVIVAGSLVTAASVSVAGIIAFVGMVVPHIARRIVGPDHRLLLPTSMLLGGLVLVLSDWLSRVLFNGIEIGVVTSLIGGPVFCYLLRKRLMGAGG